MRTACVGICRCRRQDAKSTKKTERSERNEEISTDNFPSISNAVKKCSNSNLLVICCSRCFEQIPSQVKTAYIGICRCRKQDVMRSTKEQRAQITPCSSKDFSTHLALVEAFHQPCPSLLYVCWRNVHVLLCRRFPFRDTYVCARRKLVYKKMPTAKNAAKSTQEEGAAIS